MQAHIQSWKKVALLKLQSLDQFNPTKVPPVILIQQDLKITDVLITPHFICFSNFRNRTSSFRSSINATLAQLVLS